MGNFVLLTNGEALDHAQANSCVVLTFFLSHFTICVYMCLIVLCVLRLMHFLEQLRNCMLVYMCINYLDITNKRQVFLLIFWHLVANLPEYWEFKVLLGNTAKHRNFVNSYLLENDPSQSA